MSDHILALDQGTTSSRAIVFDRQGHILSLAQYPFSQHYPQAGWVEHDPMEIWDTERRAAAEAAAHLPEGSIAGIGVTNQRETTIVWDRATGEPVYNAIVWQCRRTAELCEELKHQGLEKLAGVPVCGAAGDQQAALFGQTCFAPGEAKNTYGTGCFTLMNVGGAPVRSRAGLVSSVAWQVNGETAYALEGSVFNGGSTIQWLRDELKIIASAPEINALAASVPDSGGVVVVPAFTGLGAPYWDMYARGAILGITRGTNRGHIARAVLECIAAQVTDLMLAMRQDAGCDITLLRADGGASVSDILLQMQADLLRIPVDRPEMVETTAFGAAALAGLCCGVWRDTDELRALRRSEQVFLPKRPQADCDAEYRLWKRAVGRAADWIEH